jgi:magnesium chelatase subunit D
MIGADRWRAALEAVSAVALDPGGLGGIWLRAAAGPVRERFLHEVKVAFADRPVRFAPAHCDAGRLLGGLDLAAVLAGRGLAPQPGLLAQANGGLLILAQTERLAPARAALIGHALDRGEVRLERDGQSYLWPARFAVLALDEGGSDEAAPASLRDRLAFWIDLNGLSWRDCERGIDAGVLAAARAFPPPSALDAETLTDLADAGLQLGVDGLRAGYFAARAARALAQLNRHAHATDDDLTAAAAAVFGPRASPAQPHEESAPEPSPPPEQPQEDQPPEADAAQDLADVIVQAARAAAPANLIAALAAAGASKVAGADGRGAERQGLRHGRPIASRPGDPRGGARLALIDTLRAAAPWQKLRGGGPGRLKINRDDLRVRRFVQRRESSVIFVVDASGSAAFQRLAEVKGAIEQVLGEAYVARTHVALVAFRQTGADVLLAPTRALARARRELAELPGGGATPLAAGLDAGLALAVAEKGRGRSVMLIVMSDGRANIGRDGAAGRAQAKADALDAANRIRAHQIAAVFVDTGRWPEVENRSLATAMGARYAPLPFADAATLNALVRP